MKARIHEAIAERLDRQGLAALRDALVAGATGDVLEIGAGTGRNLARYPADATVTALEPERRYRTLLAERAAGAAATVAVVGGGAEHLPFAAAAFDHVVSSLVLCSVADPAAVLSEIRRVLRPGGSLRFLEHVRGERRVATWQRRLTPLQRRLADGCHLDRDTERLIVEAGLEIVELERLRLPGGHPLIAPALLGRAVRPADGGGADVP